MIHVGGSIIGSGGGGSALPTPVPYGTVIPLDGNKTLPRTFVSAPTTFTVGAVTNGGQAILPLVADGSSAITFSGFTQAGTSAGYDNTSGRLNLIQFFYLDGTPYYSISQAVNAQPIYQVATAYTLTGPNNATAGTASGAFTVKANGTLASAVTVTPSDGSGGTFTPSSVTLAANSTGLSSATFTYTAASAGTKSVSTTNNGGLTDPAALSVTVAAAGSNPNIRLTNLTGLNETVDGSGYDYTPTANNSYTSSYAKSSIKIPAASAGSFSVTNKAATANGVLIGLSKSATNATWNDTTNGVNYGIYTAGLGSAYGIISGIGATANAQTPVNAANGDVLRMRTGSDGTTVYAEVSKDNGSTYTTMYTWTGVTSANLYGHFQSGTTTGVLQLPSQVGAS